MPIFCPTIHQCVLLIVLMHYLVHCFFEIMNYILVLIGKSGCCIASCESSRFTITCVMVLKGWSFPDKVHYFVHCWHYITKCFKWSSKIKEYSFHLYWLQCIAEHHIDELVETLITTKPRRCIQRFVKVATLFQYFFSDITEEVSEAKFCKQCEDVSNHYIHWRIL